MDLFTFNITIEGVAVASSLLGFFGILFFSKGDKREKGILMLLFALFLAISSFDLLFFLFVGKGGFKWAILVFRTLSELAGVWFLVILGVYIGELSRLEKNKKNIQNIAVFCVGGILTILLLINLFADFLFKVGEKNTLVHGKWFALLIALEGVICLLDFIYVLLNKKDIILQDAITFSIWLILFILGCIFEIFFSKAYVFAICGILGIIVKTFGEISKDRTRTEREKRETERLRKDIIKAKEKLFQSQVSPHFIYNSLTAIRELPDNPPATKKAIGDFAKYLRQTLTTINENELIPFEKELENVQTYLRLEKLRFDDVLKVVYDIKFTDFQIPAMCVQILAENAVKHGVSVKRSGGTVTVSTLKQEEFILVSVKDDGVGFNVEKAFETTHVGINNVKNRIYSILGGQVDIQSTIGVGTVATIKIPLIAKEVLNA